MTAESENSGILVLETSHEAEIEADALLIHVQLKATSFVQGNAALKESKEIADLVRRLAHVGFPGEAIGVENVSAETAAGLLGKSSHVTYFLRLKVTQTTMIPAVMVVLAETKNLQINRTLWLFSHLEQERNEWIRQCLAVITERARIMAAGLGARVAGIARVTERLETDEQGSLRRYMPVTEGVVRRRSMGIVSGEEVSLGFETIHRERMVQRVTAELRLVPAPAAPRAETPAPPQ